MGFLICLLGLAALGMLVMRRKTKNETPASDAPQTTNAPASTVRGGYALQPSLMNATEAQLFHHIIAGLPGGVTVSTKVRLADIVQAVGDSAGDRMSAFARIKSRHVDFVVHDLRGQLICAVEFDGPTHRQPRQMEADRFLNDVMHSVGLPLVRIDHTQELAVGLQRLVDMLAARGVYHSARRAA